MRAVIAPSFLFLGLAWFEMSGGTEFEPGMEGVAIFAPAHADDATTATMVAEAQERTQGVAVDPDALAETVALARMDIAGEGPAQPILASTGGSATATPAVMAANAAPARATDMPAPDAATPILDFRAVTGSRVNLRSGPGLSNAVLTQLVRGDEVEVLSDPGRGWVELRALQGDATGWMSDDFLTAIN